MSDMVYVNVTFKTADTHLGGLRATCTNNIRAFMTMDQYVKFCDFYAHDPDVTIETENMTPMPSELLISKVEAGKRTFLWGGNRVA